MNIYRTLISNCPDAIAIVNQQGNIIECNRSFLDLTGQSSVVQRSINELITPEWKQLNLTTQVEPQSAVLRLLNQRAETQVDILYDDKNLFFILTILSPRQENSLTLQLLDTEKRFKALFDNSFDAIAYFNIHTGCEMANKAFCDLIGYTLEEIQQLEYTDYTPPGWKDVDQQITEQIYKSSSTDIFEKEYIHKNGKIVSVSMRATGVRNDSGELIGTWFIFRDISENQKQVRKLKHQQQLLEQTGRLAGVGGWEFVEKSTQVKFTPEALKLLGLPKSYSGNLFETLKLFAEESRYELQASVEVALLLNTPFDIETEYLGFKQPRWLKLTGRVKKEGTQKYIVGAIQDISKFRKNSKVSNSNDQVGTVEGRTFRDALTKLPNQTLLNDRLKRSLKHRNRYTHPLVFLELDLMQFRRINENAGYSAGDACLKEIVRRLQYSLRKEDMLARIGGDEFAIIAENCPSARAENLADQLLNSIEKIINFEGQNFLLKAVVSIVVVTGDVGTTDIYRAAEKGIDTLKAEQGNLGTKINLVKL